MVFSPFERMVALRYLRARREEGFVSVIAVISLASIVLGVAALIIVMSVLNGFRAELLTRVFGLSGHLGIQSAEGGALEGYAAIARRIRGVAGVVRVVPVVEGQVMASAKGISRAAKVRGVAPAQLRARPIIADNIRAGTLDDFTGQRSVLVGARFARRFGVKPGDKLLLIAPQSRPATMGSLPQIKSYRIAAIFSVGMVDYDSGTIFMPLDAARLYFGTGQGVTKLEIVLADAERIDAMVGPVGDAAGAGVRLVHWRDINAALFTALEVERAVTFVIVALIILVAAFNIISGLIMLVKDKGRDIAILRTMGATRAMVMRIFLLAGASIGVIGTAAGFALGLGFAANIETMGQWLQALPRAERFAGEIAFFSNLPSRVETADVIVVVVMSLGLSFLATLYPAWRAARLDPVEALRYE